MEFLYFNELSDEIHFQTKEGLRVITDQYFWVFIEVLCDRRYIFYRDFTQREYVIFDVGANRGYASMFFALDDKCRNVFSFEPCKKAYEFFGRHMSLNPALSSKIAKFNYGISDKTEHQVFRIHPTHDGINSGNSQFIDSYLDEKWKTELVSEEVELRQASLGRCRAIEAVAPLATTPKDHENRH
jgi:FkbM family methyltransferase